MKKSLKLLLVALLTIVLCASTLTACNTVEENDGDSKNEKASENTVEVTTEVENETDVTKVPHSCVYDNHKCTICGYTMCIDEDNDNYCDVCRFKYVCIDDKTCKIYGIDNYDITTLEIPKYVGAYKVIEISDYAFDFCMSITSITIPESVTHIGVGAFACSNDIETLTVDINNPNYYSEGNCIIEKSTNTLLLGCKNSVIPSGVTSIGYFAFYYSDLTSINIPDGVTSIREFAFEGCDGLTSITIPESVTSIGRSAFKGCDGLTSITIPESVTHIGESAFYGCYGLTSITIPASVTHIGVGAFACNDDIETLTVDINNPNYYSEGNCIIDKSTNTLLVGCKNSVIPSNVTNIGDSAFSGCSSLTSITIPEGVTNIGEYAFTYCSSLTSITIPEGVTSIGKFAFEGCSGLASITLPKSITSIEESTFNSCSGLTSITIPEGVTSIGYQAFFGCSGITSITILEGVTSIGMSAFEGCSSLTSIDMPKSVTSIEIFAFGGSDNLTTINFNGTISEWNQIPLENSGLDRGFFDYTYTVYCTDGEITKN